MKITYDNTYNGHPINNSELQGCFIYILHRIFGASRYMLKKHNKIFTLRFDLRTSDDAETSRLDSKKIDHFIENITVDLTRNNPLHQKGKKKATSSNLSRHSVDPHVLITLEQHGTEKPHAHCLIIVNGNAKQSAWDILQRVERQYKNVLKDEYKLGLVDYCDKKGPNSYLILRDDIVTFNAFFYQASYLAKVRGKGRLGKGEWIARGTRISKKQRDETEKKGKAKAPSAPLNLPATLAVTGALVLDRG